MRSVPDLPVAPSSVNSALDQDLGFTLGVIFRAYIKAANAVVSDIPGGPRGYHVIVAAIHHQADSQGALAQRLGVDRTVMTYLIDDLEAAGVVERRADPVDRRNRHIVATLRGRHLWFVQGFARLWSVTRGSADCDFERNAACRPNF